MFRAIGQGTAIMLLVVSGAVMTEQVSWAETRSPVAPAATPGYSAIVTTERNWRDWFLCGSKGACGGTTDSVSVVHDPVDIPRNPKAQTDENKPVNSLLFTIDALPGTLPGLKISTP